MSEKIVVKAEKREKSGKGYARRLRAEGKIPITVYGGGGESVSVSANLSDLAAILRTESGPNTIFSLDVADVGTNDVIFQDRQIDPLKGRLLHADLRRLTKGEKIEMTVPVHLIGEPAGVSEGGVLEQSVREVKVFCDPANTPESLDADVSGLGINESLHISDLKVGKNIDLHESPDTVIASVVMVKEEVEETSAEAGEPEIVGKDKGEE